MEVLANGFKANFWLPIEEEPDIDRFVDEQILIDMDRFMLVGTLEKVSTTKKKNEEKEFEYFKQITVQVCNICSAADNNVNIQIPGKKEEFLYDVKFRYAPEPQQVDGDDMEPVEQAAAAAESDADADISAEDFESPSLDEMIKANEALPEEPAAEAAEKAAEKAEEADRLRLLSAINELDALDADETKMDIEGDQVGKEDIGFEFSVEPDEVISGEEVLNKVSENIQLPDLAEGEDEKTEEKAEPGTVTDADIDAMFDDDLMVAGDKPTPSEPEKDPDLDLDDDEDSDGIDWGD